MKTCIAESFAVKSTELSGVVIDGCTRGSLLHRENPEESWSGI